jgi:hypothetical protein
LDAVELGHGHAEAPIAGVVPAAMVVEDAMIGELRPRDHHVVFVGQIALAILLLTNLS